MKTKVSKIMLWPSRTVNLGNYNSVKLDAGIELVFDKPVALNSKEYKEAFDEGKKTINKYLSDLGKKSRKDIYKKEFYWKKR